ncbi:hypothetical protein BDV93DRAFT_526724 [Ceratobasidium sp. AG-I]|nr:hypothetical protein BDV93DRAFT_526724 [Ceratobasidium sp. AG-I]
MLADILPDSLLESSEGEMLLYQELHDLIEHTLSQQLLEAKLGPIAKELASSVHLALKSPSLLDKLESDAREAFGHTDDDFGYEARMALADFIKPVLWYADVDLKMFDTSALLSENWSHAEQPGYLFGDEQVWCVCADLITSALSEAVTKSALRRLSNQVHLVLVEALPGTGHPNAIRHRNMIDKEMPKIEEILEAAIINATRESVGQAVAHIREHEYTSRVAASHSMAEAIKKMFPDTLPTALRIPALRINSVQRSLWLLQPESVLCLWRSRYKLRPCEKLSHKELQAYILRRIKVHAQDARFLGRPSTSNAEADIREALSRVWVASVNALTGICPDNIGA